MLSDFSHGGPCRLSGKSWRITWRSMKKKKGGGQLIRMSLILTFNFGPVMRTLTAWHETEIFRATTHQQRTDEPLESELVPGIRDASAIRMICLKENGV